jgi:hypothetical protein
MACRSNWDTVSELLKQMVNPYELFGELVALARACIALIIQ